MNSATSELPRPGRHTAYGRWLSHPVPGEEVVISGMAGDFPECNGMDEYHENLMKKVDMVTGDDRRWKKQFYSAPQRTGKLKRMNRFDASFFDRCFHEAHAMDPGCRMMLERSYEAVLDAGVNPASLEGKRLGVYMGVCFGETENLIAPLKGPKKWGLKTFSRCILSSFITRAFKAEGPIYMSDTACSSSLHSLDDAFQALRLGQIDAAIVGGWNLLLLPKTSYLFYLLGVLSPGGSCKVFDEKADGYVRSEAAVALFLQRSADANRIYATIAHVQSNCDGYKDTAISFPSELLQKELLLQTFGESSISPSEIDYLEAHGTGTKVGDPVEMRALDRLLGKHFSEDRPLLIGSVRSNIGHTEAVSGVCSLAKVILAMETGVIPPNIRYYKPKQDLIPIVEKRFKVVSEPTKHDCKTVSVSSFGFGGANSHVLVRWNPRDKARSGAPVDGLPRLVLASGRSTEAVDTLLRRVVMHSPMDEELVSLYNNAFSKPVPGHISKGYAIVGSKGGASASIQTPPAGVRKVWFVFPGTGSAWPGMGKLLMNVPLFASTIDICHEIAMNLGVDLKHIITSQNGEIKSCVENIMALVAMQLALVDVLKEVGVQAEGFVGWGVGELACAYADGCLSPQKALLGAYVAAVAMQHPSVPLATNALVGLEADGLTALLPKEVCISTVCSVDCCIITGPKEAMKKTLADLASRGAQVQELADCIPCHSPYLNEGVDAVYSNWIEAVPKLDAKPSKWRSSNGGFVQLTPGHLLDALRRPADACRQLLALPPDAVLLEVSGAAWLHALLTHAAFADFTCVSLGHGADPLHGLLHALGRLYVSGVAIDPSPLYSQVQRPVARGTPFISPAITWDHSLSWRVHGDHENHMDLFTRTITFDLSSPENAFFMGHVVDGRPLFPAAGVLFMMIEFVGKCLDYSADEYIVIFENLKLERAIPIRENGTVKLLLNVHKENGHFEVLESGVSVASGILKYKLAGGETALSNFQPPPEIPGIRMDANDIYKEFRLRGYEYRDAFRSIESIDTQGTSALIKWFGNWVTFMDNMLQTRILTLDTRNIYFPITIEKFVIDLPKHNKIVEDLGENKVLPVYYDTNSDTVRGGGIEITGMTCVPVPRKKNLSTPLLESYRFVPLRSTGLDVKELLAVCFQMLLENTLNSKVRVLEMAGKRPVLANSIFAIFADIPIAQPEVTLLSPPDHPGLEGLEPEVKVYLNDLNGSDKDFSVIVASDLLQSGEKLEAAAGALHHSGFLFTREGARQAPDLGPLGLQVVSEQQLGDEKVLILKKVQEDVLENEIAIAITGGNFDWLPEIQKALSTGDSKVVIYSQGEPDSGIIGLFHCLAREGHERKLSCFLILDEQAPKFDVSHPFYRQQLRKHLAVNVLQDGAWGTFRFFRLGAPAPRRFRHVYSNVISVGDLSTLTWQQGPLDAQLDEVHMDVTHVKYAALNFRDVMGATGRLAVDVLEKHRLKQECVLGLEYSGYTWRGERVMGLTPRGGLSTLVERSQTWEWSVPEKWTLTEAASVPMAYLTVVCAFKKGQLKRNESVLIHAGSGGVGQAAINYCLFHGCTVFTTVGTPEKRDFLLKRFPKLAPGHIGNSRDTSFEQMVLRGTGGCGVDLVLNSLAGDKLQASVRCLAPGGRFLEIGKFDLAQNSMLAMSMFEKGQSFHGIHLDEHLQDPNGSREAFTAMLQNAINEGSVQPLPPNVFSAKQVEEAFRYMANGKHMGKVIIKLSEGEDNCVNRKHIMMEAYPKFYCKQRCSYIVVGGLGGFGMELADWLILRGARKILLVSRKGVSNGYQAYQISRWQQYGVEVVVSSADFGSAAGAELLIRKAQELGPVDGIFNLAGVWNDALLEDQTSKKFADTAYPKVVATRMLDQASRRLCPDLRQFVVFSSIVAGRGNAGQINYGFSNSAMERICEARARDGLPGLAIQWSAVSEVGLFGDKDYDQDIVISGSKSQKITSCLKSLDRFLVEKIPVVSSMVVAEKGSTTETVDNIVTTIANILGLRDVKTVQANSKLSELGMDSMMSVEIKQLMEQRFELFFSPQDVRNMTIEKLQEMEDALGRGETLAPVASQSGSEDTDSFTKMIHGDQATASKVVLPLDSLANGDSSTPLVFAFPGTDGAATELTPLSKNIKAHVIGMQFAYSECKTIREMASSFVQEILPRLAPNQRVNLLGYSYGGIVAMEALLLLEAAGIQGKLVMLDSSPSYARVLLMNYFALDSNDSDVAVQNKLLRRLFMNSSQKEYASVDKLMASLEKVESWEDRIRHFLKVVKTNESSADQLVRRIQTMYVRVEACLKYQWLQGKKIVSPVVLLRPTQAAAKQKEQDYGLSEYCANEIEVRFVEGNHVTLLSNSTSAEIVNSHLV